MATAQKKDKGLNKHSFRGLTPDQINDLSQEKVVELFRARLRRRFSRSNPSPMQRSSTNTSASTPNAKKARRTPKPERSPSPLRPISATPSSCQKWSATMWPSTTERASTMLRSSSTWSADTLASSHSPTSPAGTVRPVSVPPRDPLTPHSNDQSHIKHTKVCEERKGRFLLGIEILNKNEGSAQWHSYSQVYN